MDVKNEIARVDRKKKCCMLSEIAGFIRMCGTVKPDKGGNQDLYITTENPAIARLFLRRIKDYFGLAVVLNIKQSNVLKKNRIYELIIKSENNAQKVIRETSEIFPESIKDRSCKRAFLQGVFLGSGTISHPEKSYHVEIVCDDENLAEGIMTMINSFGLGSKVIKRRNSYVVYLKEGEQISDLLALLGANKQVMEFENIRIIKELRNRTNRIVNCESANLDKTIDSAVRQIDAIKLIELRGGLEILSDKLREVAELRLENPESSLAELGQLLQPPLQKSGVNHRFRKIEEIADRLR